MNYSLNGIEQCCIDLTAPSGCFDEQKYAPVNDGRVCLKLNNSICLYILGEKHIYFVVKYIVNSATIFFFHEIGTKFGAIYRTKKRLWGRTHCNLTIMNVTAVTFWAEKAENEIWFSDFHNFTFQNSLKRLIFHCIYIR